MKRRFPLAIGLAACLALPACTGTSDDVLTLNGSYSGTTASECQLAVRFASNWKLAGSHAVGSTFREEFAVPPKRDRYYAEIHCTDGKQGSSPEFDFNPPRTRVDLQHIDLN